MPLNRYCNSAAGLSAVPTKVSPEYTVVTMNDTRDLVSIKSSERDKARSKFGLILSRRCGFN